MTRRNLIGSLVVGVLGVALASPSGLALTHFLLGQSDPPQVSEIYIDITPSRGALGRNGSQRQVEQSINQFYEVASPGSKMEIWVTGTTPGQPTLLLERERQAVGAGNLQAMQEAVQAERAAAVDALRAQLRNIEQLQKAHKLVLPWSPVIEDSYFVAGRAGSLSGATDQPVFGQRKVLICSDLEQASPLLNANALLKGQNSLLNQVLKRFPKLAFAPTLTYVYFPGRQAGDGAKQSTLKEFFRALSQGWGCPAPQVIQPQNFQTAPASTPSRVPSNTTSSAVSG